MKKKSVLVLALALLVCASLLVTGVAATIAENVNANEEVQEQIVEFADVKDSDWFYDDVKYVQSNKLMTGTSGTEFSPSGVTTRGMIVTILWRVEGEPEVEGKDFEDVSADAWYSKAVAWASSNKIVSGYSDTTFGPNDTATREQLATIMYRYASYKNCDLSHKAKLDKYEDREEISYYAVESIEWANANGIISGTSEVTISPKDNVLRSQVAAILRRFCEKFEIIKDVANDKQNNTEEKKEETSEEKKEEEKEDTKEDNDSGSSGGVIIGAGSFGDEDEIENGNDSGNVEDNDQKEEVVPEIKDDDEDQRTTLNVNTTYGNPGETVKVLVDLKNNPGILGMILQIEYDEEAMTLIGAENGEAVNEVLALTTSKELISGAKFVWDGLEIAPEQIKDGTLIILEFMLSDDAISGKRYPLTLKYNSGDIIDANFDSVNPLIKQGFIEINQQEY